MSIERRTTASCLSCFPTWVKALRDFGECLPWAIFISRAPPTRFRRINLWVNLSLYLDEVCRSSLSPTQWASQLRVGELGYVSIGLPHCHAWRQVHGCHLGPLVARTQIRGKAKGATTVKPRTAFR